MRVRNRRWTFAAVAGLALSWAAAAHAQASGKTAAQLIEEYRQRQQELANRGAPPIDGSGGGGQAGGIGGNWSANCTYASLPGRVFPNVGTFELVMQAGGAVGGYYRDDGGRYNVTGRVQGNGAANGTAVASDGSGAIAWQGTLAASGGTWSGSGSLTRSGGDINCNGQWRTR